IPPRAPVFVSPAGPGRRPGGPGAIGVRLLPVRLVTRRNVGASRVPGQPWCAYAVFSDPGGNACPVALGAGVVAPASGNSEGSPRVRQSRGWIARLGHWLSTPRRNDYAPPRQTGLRPRARSSGWDWLPTGLLRKVSAMHPLHPSPFPELCSTQCPRATRGRGPGTHVPSPQVFPLGVVVASVFACVPPRVGIRARIDRTASAQPAQQRDLPACLLSEGTGCPANGRAAHCRTTGPGRTRQPGGRHFLPLVSSSAATLRMTWKPKSFL